METVMEVWKAISGYEGVYEVSNLGNVKRVLKACGTKTGPLKGVVGDGGRIHVNLCKNGVHKVHRVHKLVAETFLGDRPKGMEINHKDHNNKNNNVSNLEYISGKDNIEHYRDAVRRGVIKAPDMSKKLTRDSVVKIRELSPEMTHNALALLFGVSESTIREIVKGEIWRQ